MAKILRNDPNRRMDNVAGSRVGLDLFPEQDYAKLDPTFLPVWIDQLRDAEAAARRLRGRLESMLSEDRRSCPVCTGIVTGRADRVYCGSTCRQRHRRKSQLQP